MKKALKQRILKSVLAASVVVSALYLPTAPVSAASDDKAAPVVREDIYGAPATGANANAPLVALPEHEEPRKPLPGEPTEPDSSSWGYDVKTGKFTHPKYTPDNEGPQPFNGSLPYLDQNQYLKNTKVEAFYPYVAGYGHSWQTSFDLDGRRYLYDYETNQYNLFDITDPLNAKHITTKWFDTKVEHQFGPLNVKYNKTLDKNLAVQCYEVPRYGKITNKYLNPKEVDTIREWKMLRGFRIYEVNGPNWTDWKVLSETPLDSSTYDPSKPQQGSGCQDIPVYSGDQYLFVAGAPNDSYANTEYKTYLYSGAQIAYDISDPTKPKQLDIWSVPGQIKGEEADYNKNPRAGNKTSWMGSRMPLFIPKTVEEGGKYGYAAMGGFGFYVVDITDPANMKTVSHIDMPMSYTGTEGDNIDVSKVETTGMVYYSGYPLSEDCHEPYKEIYAIDVRDPKNPKIATTLERPTPPKDAPFTDYCQRRGSFGPKRTGYAEVQPGTPSQKYMPYSFYNAGMQMFDLTTPDKPTIAAYFVPKMAGELTDDEGNKYFNDQSDPVHGIFVEWDRNLIWVFSGHGMYVVSSPLLGEPVKGMPQAGLQVADAKGELATDSQPFTRDGATMVPLRSVFEKLGLTVSWDAAANKITGKKDELTLELIVGEKFVTVNGEKKETAAATIVEGGRAFVSLKTIADAAGVKAEWNNKAKTVVISSK
ncbi:copper amine oxidase N-terminal domain-containing protein [Paenibacillus sp. N1-5-1-14]|uniref:copper amine oxidase N-terminal domain-containing protein n=1 Tax=Paenibacillus radicibacter TaxID=2972488 RepID=UPI002159674C|nr:copper amine oxidase N-terminal domain-containing protein [Paenibacillus radicibacter]MCR8644034.1 copper amine oxidase N-terminal domain-containing protein [Paenibacillus radicibacter]